MKRIYLLLVVVSGLAACADWPEQSDALDLRASSLDAPALLPQDQLLAPLDLTAQAQGAALAARAAALQATASRM